MHTFDATLLLKIISAYDLIEPLLYRNMVQMADAVHQQDPLSGKR